MDRQGIIGMGLLMVVLAAYLWYTGNVADTAKKLAAKNSADSLAKVKLITPKIDSNINSTDTNKTTKIPIADSQKIVAATKTIIENKVMKVTFTNMGAMPVSVELKNFKTALDKSALQVFKEGQNSFDVSYKTTAGAMLHTKSELFTPLVTGKTITYTASNGATISYTLGDSSYMMDVAIDAKGSVDVSNKMHLDWTSIAPQNEYDQVQEMQYNHVAYNEENEGTDYYSITDEKTKELKNALKYLSFKQHYFNTSLINASKNFNNVKISSRPTNDTSNKTLASMNASMNLGDGQINKFQIYSGPNDYHLMKSYGNSFEEIIPLEYSKYLSFIKYLNKWVILPIFDMLTKFVKNFGWVIMLLTIIVRLLMSPIQYKSYVSSAKMKALKPELDELRAKHGDDQQAFGVAQMELFRTAGVSPLGGCMPALLQLPIFFALLSFFPNALQLRQAGFLWAKDLSTFDVIYKLPFTIPMYGNHISLWTLLFVATSLFLALYNMNSTPTDNSNPALKYMPFIMPVLFLGIFNKMPASLTFYYVVSNVFTIILQYVIQNFIIDHDKIRAQILENKTKGPKTNKFMEKMAEMQKQNAERMKQQAGKKK